MQAVKGREKKQLRHGIWAWILSLRANVLAQPLARSPMQISVRAQLPF